MAEASPNLHAKKLMLLLPFVVISTMLAAHTIQYCGVSPCKVCSLQQLSQATKVVSLVSNKSHLVNINGSCKTSSCIYMITCKRKDWQKYTLD